VGKKVTELLGEEEPTLTTFIMELLDGHAPGCEWRLAPECSWQLRHHGYILWSIQMQPVGTQKHVVRLPPPITCLPVHLPSPPACWCALPTAKLEEEVSAILDKEAGPFALKLYRMVIYESEKNALGIKDP
jgi:hypothetical protein